MTKLMSHSYNLRSESDRTLTTRYKHYIRDSNCMATGGSPNPLPEEDSTVHIDRGQNDSTVHIDSGPNGGLRLANSTSASRNVTPRLPRTFNDISDKVHIPATKGVDDLERELAELQLEEKKLALYTEIQKTRDRIASYQGVSNVSKITEERRENERVVQSEPVQGPMPYPLQDDYQLHHELMGVKRELGTAQKPVDIITPDLLIAIRRTLNLRSIADSSFWCACLVSFFGLLRPGNIVVNRIFNKDRDLRRLDAFACNWGFIIRLRWTKTIQFREKVFEVLLPRIQHELLCPAKAIELMLSLTVGFDPLGPLFLADNDVFLNSNARPLPSLMHNPNSNDNDFSLVSTPASNSSHVNSSVIMPSITSSATPEEIQPVPSGTPTVTFYPRHRLRLEQEFTASLIIDQQKKRKELLEQIEADIAEQKKLHMYGEALSEVVEARIFLHNRQVLIL
ncbi:hypothetical protein KUTeg_015384 [Tegillarca granosa]|uniref:Uncharacterized protein n=1 Tax=Tegillarca granosa TaxID=220873 RepID=A0ABQ9EUG6_TEGGR|nr:hypothetical protein KUTeg_015384 [Tegillarca granosa]